ncbi:TPA: LPXTG cell wall anchor domain-containing protein [Enterococcus faecium]|nr:LPXTG cell wall anchor domain-containing protein [Enterococcus faecium]HBM7170577.1 LPXTG cell wall anchor domain-containing protein [Enterococcus faecium]
MISNYSKISLYQHHLTKSPKRALPKTGSQSNNWITLAGVILLVIGLRITFMSYKKSKR